MRLASVNIGEARELVAGDPASTSGICKQPTGESVHLGRLGLAGDTVIDSAYHGGPDQAVYVYGGADYDWWAGELGGPLEPGTFGDNLTIAGLASAGFAVGDRLEIGDSVVIEVSAPRMPCGTLARRMGDPQFVRRFRDGERPGLYCRVIAEGIVRAGDAVTHTPHSGDRVTMLEIFREHYAKQRSEATLRRFLAAPLAERERAKMLARLERLAAAAS